MLKHLKLWTSLATLIGVGAGVIYSPGLSSLAHAADDATSVRVRGGEHGAYSRLVFDWGRKVRFSVRGVSGRDDLFDIHFRKDAALDVSRLNAARLKWVDSVKPISDEPLIVRVDVADGRRLKASRLGNRVIFDAVKADKAPAKAKAKDKVVSGVPAKKPAVKKLDANKLDTKAESETKSLDQSQVQSQIKSEVEPKVKPEAVSKVKPDVQSKMAAHKVKAAKPVKAMRWGKPKPLKVINSDIKRPNVVSISSVSSLSLAAFVANGKLWLVSGQEDAFVSPQIVGDQAGDLGAPEFIEHEDAKVLNLPALKGATYDMTGGGLSWRLLVGADLLPEKQATKPQRRGVSPHLGRSGEVFWPLKGVDEVVDIRDAETGDLYKVVTVYQSGAYSGAAYEMVDFDVLPSSLGIAVRPKVDDLIVEAVEGGIVIRRGGADPLSLSQQKDVDMALYTAGQSGKVAAYYGKPKDGDVRKGKRGNLMLDFAQWESDLLEDGAELASLSKGKAQALAALPGYGRDQQIETLLDMARMYASAGMGYEARGFLRIVEGSFPALALNPEYQALVGVADALSGHYEDALKALSSKLLKSRDEIRYWLSYCLANLADWDQAAAILPADLSDIHYFSPAIAAELSVSLAEVALRAGDQAKAQELFSILEDKGVAKVMRGSQMVAMTYLKGEDARQSGEFEMAIKLWKGLADGDDDLYRVRAGLALARLEMDHRGLALPDAIDRLERLRYAWRGDDLEGQVNFWLGRVYFDDNQYVKGLNIMKDSASYAKSPYLGRRIVSDMKNSFEGLYLSEQLTSLAPADAAALYEHFPELVPEGDVGHLMERRLADHLAQAHLYDRAIDIYLTQLDSVLDGADAREAALKLARLYQLNDAADQSLLMLDRLENIGDPDGNMAHEITLLRARGLSRDDKVAQALEMLSVDGASAEMNALRAEIAWQHGYWEDAAEALHFVMLDRGISPEQALNNGQDEVVLQRAVALNLGGDRIRLANLREVYGQEMYKMPKGSAFEAVTRAHQRGDLADRETLLAVASEIDVFSGFLEAY